MDLWGEKEMGVGIGHFGRALFACILWSQLEDMFQLIGTPHGQVTVQLKDTPTKVYAIGAKLSLSKMPLEVLQNRVLIQLIDTSHIFKNRV